MMSFKDFIDDYRDGSINNNVTWRAYDIESAVRPSHIRNALSRLGYLYAGELAIPTVQAHYKIESLDSTRALLGYWWLLYQASIGNRGQLKVRKAKIKPPGGGLQPRKGSARGNDTADP
jgi:hypothetical protein